MATAAAHAKRNLFGVPGGFMYVSYGIHHCVNVVTDRADWANSVLLRAVALPDEPERIAAGPTCWHDVSDSRCDDSRPVTGEHDVWMAPGHTFASQDLVTTTRIGGPGRCNPMALVHAEQSQCQQTSSG